MDEAPPTETKVLDLEIVSAGANGATIPSMETSLHKRPREEDGESNTANAAVNNFTNNMQHPSLAVDNDAPAAKRIKASSSDQDDYSNHKAKADNVQETKPESFVETVFSPALTRSQRAARSGKGTSKGGAENGEKTMDADSSRADDNDETVDTADKRWRVHQMAEDYVTFVGNVMYPATKLGPYGYNPEAREYPIQSISLLHYIKSPLRRPSVMEKWSPYEIAVFEGSLLHYGKEFPKVSREIGTKSTEDVIDFYYIWKKTDHYKKWKEHFISDAELLDDMVESPVRKPKR